ncbi:hypothetical protein QR685DRAFT_574620 [Neurospora intermedia]|uniref:Uncharacterized protein n=1 Tax=Neurospora intermedia TaxID=5142 RepID=A0ABR3D611_NEUIN
MGSATSMYHHGGLDADARRRPTIGRAGSAWVREHWPPPGALAWDQANSTGHLNRIIGYDHCEIAFTHTCSRILIYTHEPKYT